MKLLAGSLSIYLLAKDLCVCNLVSDFVAVVLLIDEYRQVVTSRTLVKPSPDFKTLNY